MPVIYCDLSVQIHRHTIPHIEPYLKFSESLRFNPLLSELAKDELAYGDGFDIQDDWFARY